MPAGRKRVLDDVKRSEVCALISVGCSVDAAARYVGCNPSTIRRESARNLDFHEQLRRAELAAELQPLHALRRAAATHWRAAAWFLERTRPAQFARFSPNLCRIDDVEELMDHWLQLIGRELPDTPESDAAYRRLNLAMQSTCRELRAATAVSRDPKQIRKIIDRMRPRPKWPIQLYQNTSDEPATEEDFSTDEDTASHAELP